MRCIRGDWDGHKGVYHINAVDEVTHWEVVAATPRIAEFWLIPVVAMLHPFPLLVRAFHSDDGASSSTVTLQNCSASC